MPALIGVQVVMCDPPQQLKFILADIWIFLAR